MALRTVAFQVLKFAFSLWLTASFVFMMARLLPAGQTPKGMNESDAATYGAADAASRNRLKADFQKRTGLDKPLFYFKVLLKGQKVADQLKPSPIDQPWVSEAVLRHGKEETTRFYDLWQQWFRQAPEQSNRLLLPELLSWAYLDVYAERKIQENEIAEALRVSQKPSSNQLLTAWQNLVDQPAPIYYYFPVLEWQGRDNVYHHWITQLLQGNLGSSSQDYELVSTKIKDGAAISIALGLLGLLAALLVSFFAGLYFTQNPLSPFTFLLRQFMFVLDSIPAFLIALSLLGVFLLIGGSVFPSFEADNDDSFWRYVASPSILLGSLCVSLLIIPHLTLQFHRSLASQTSALYQRTALAKGLTFQKTLLKHLVPNALLPTITLVSEVVIGLMAGILVVEITFSLPGIGSLLTKSILNADYPVLVGLTLMLLTFRLVVVGLTEMVYRWADPRMRNN
ncbi:ABC transporter permease [Rufibacter hautae]|uniref:ABC transporter permease n=1 Tax=Rufibacter hautae TaxID=2595005 RepID=A0A5B6TCQ8_9BACT|nr:ABC transporter permease [Rufibacter hautae]KAA3437958.1 ABC transporter permease [Rufibacter hautae]